LLAGVIMRVLLLIGCLSIIACDDDTTPTVNDMTVPLDMAMGNATAARGEYLVKHLLVCGDCHTTPDAMGMPSTKPEAFLAGGRAFPVGPGKTVYARNITPDDTTGIGKWTESQIVDAIKTGVDDQGLPLFPIMPYYMFHNLTDDDAMSIALYLKSIPARSNMVMADTVTVPLASPVIMDAQVPHTTLATSDPNYASAERGRYLAEVSCIECHTPHNGPMASSVIDLANVFAGGETFNLGFETTVSANLTSDTATGLGSWSAMDIVKTLKTDQEKGTGRRLCPPMPGGPDELGGLSDPDLTDVANYIHTLAPIVHGPYGCTDAGVPYDVPDGG
jgi:mono/diheme cytochrome c family protein